MPRENQIAKRAFLEHKIFTMIRRLYDRPFHLIFVWTSGILQSSF